MLIKFRYPIYNPCVNSVDVATDWNGLAFDTTQDIDVALAQPFSIAAMRVFYNEPHVFSYDPEIAQVDVSQFDLVLLSDVEYAQQWEIEAWINKNNIKNYVLALGGRGEHDTPDPKNMLYRPYWVKKYLEKNQFVDTQADHKPYMFDCMLGARRPHRDYVMLAMTRTGLLDHSIVTYRSGFPGEIINEYTKKYAEHFPDTPLCWPYVSPNLDPDWEVTNQMNNQISFISPNQIFQNTYYSILTETLGTGNNFFLSEKTIKAMFARRVFVVFGIRHYLKHLRELGFQTFEGVIDESYDDEPHDEIRFQKAMLQVMRLAWFENPKTVYDLISYALDNNQRTLAWLCEKSQQQMQELLQLHIPGQHLQFRPKS